MPEQIIIPDAEIHPAADIFPMMSPEELDALADDIREHGQRESCVFYQGELLDGRNRWAACQRLGIDPETCDIEDDDLDAVAYVMSANLHRRHLSADQKRDVIAKVLKQKPDQSNRLIAKDIKVSHNTVKAVRDDLESTGQIDQLDKTTGADGKARPARRPQVELSVVPPEGDIDERVDDAESAAEALAKQGTPHQRGRAVSAAADAINALKLVGRDNPLRQSAYRQVADFVTHNCPEVIEPLTDNVTSVLNVEFDPSDWSPRMRDDAVRTLHKFDSASFKLSGKPRDALRTVFRQMINMINEASSDEA